MTFDGGSVPDAVPHPARVSRRAVLGAGAWTLPVVALAVAAPRASASTGEPSFTTLAPLTVGGEPDSLVFPLLMSEVPAQPASEDGDFVGLLVVLCLPEGLEVTGASSGDGVGWAFTDGSAGFEGGEVFVFNATAITAGYSGTLLITIAQAPAAGLHGELGADVVLGSTGDFAEIAWTYAYPDPTGPTLPNCAAA
ncbi:hypothetical protein N1031_03215 [Herbiconiux moechotypicola]|uniref:Uncharacterized protein n=1 Tax=Herbiconiux moechotypicola TaxID=637393 RepID=A0ABP5Q9V9_9MICO|nr:hypothetical protein [Herbiconiux moechotypicola]MCS5728758.1 hypothetical protein [Herbiconiux moechotypicola]